MRSLLRRADQLHRSQTVDGNDCNCLNRNRWALNSAVECHPHTVEVIGSNPIAPTINQLQMRDLPRRACPKMSNLSHAICFQGRTIRTTLEWAARFCSLTA